MQLIACQQTARLAQPPRIDRGELLHKHPRALAADLHFRSKGGGEGASRSWGDGDSGQTKQGLGLEKDPVPLAGLLGPSGSARCPKPKDLTPLQAGIPSAL